MGALELLSAVQDLEKNGLSMFERFVATAHELCEKEVGISAETEALKRDRTKLNEDRERFAAECQSVCRLNQQLTDQIVLDVGGRRFHTTRQTLCSVPGSMLAAWFSGRHAVQTQPDGSVFIDRSPLLFEYVLDFHRTGGVQPLMPGVENAKERLRDEFEFFCLPWPGEEPSIVDLCRGEPQCMVLDTELDTDLDRDHLAVYLSSRHNRLLTAETGQSFKCKLWDTTTGKVLRTWPKEDYDFGTLEKISIDHRQTYVVGVYSKEGDVKTVTAVLYSLADGIMEKSMPVHANASHEWVALLRGDTLILRTKDEKVIYAHSITTGVVLWQMTPDAADPTAFPDDVQGQHSDEAFVGVTRGPGNRFIGVYDINTGTELYGKWSKRDRQTLWLSGKQLGLLSLSKSFNTNRNMVVFESWDEKGDVLVPATTLITPSRGENGYSLRFHGPNVFSMATNTGLNVYVLKHPTPCTVAVAECLMLNLRQKDERWYETKISGTALVALGYDGKARVWSLPKDQSSKCRGLE